MVGTFLRELEIEPPSDPVMPFPGIYSRGPKNAQQRCRRHPTVHSSTSHDRQNLETIRVPEDGQLGKETVVHLRSGLLRSYRENEVMEFAYKWTDMESAMPSGMSQR